MSKKIHTAIGLMSGTSLDGVDAALIETDGLHHVRPVGFVTLAYDADVRERIRACFGLRYVTDPRVRDAARSLTLIHMQAIEDLLKIHGDGQFRPDIIGFHGQTITHDPAAGLSLQIGDAELLARHTQIPVVHDFRSVDIAHGGQGAPLLPLYHRARILSSDIREPVAIVNIGGVANVTWIDPTYGDDPYAGILAFDTGPGNALMDDCLLARTGQPYDADGQLASRGQVSQDVLQKLLDQAREYLAQQPPKSLDRDVWDTSVINDLSDADALATLCAFTVEMIARGLDYMPTAPACWYVSGGGRLNAWLMHQLEARLQASVQPVEMLGWNGDATEAEGFAYLAVRSLLDLPLSLPLTSGVNHPVSGGKIFYNI